MSETTSTQQSQSSSSTTPVQTTENNIMNQVSGVASGMASSLYNWAQGVYAQTSAITNQTVGNFFQASQNMMGLSNNMINQYNSLFAPENAELVADANSYDSPARVEADMGMAGGTAAQAGQAAEQNSIQQLQQYGIDPSSGRYASLVNADNVQNAANVAGAENTQRVADTQMGQNLRAQAVQTGAQLPSSIANVTNTGIQANTGAENATLANANTGANLMALPNNYLQTAMGVKMPFNQQQSSGTSSGNSSGNKQQPSQSGSGNGSGSGAGSGGANTPAWGMNNPAYGGPPSMQFNGAGNGTGYTDPGFPGGVSPGDFTGGNIYNPDPNAGQDLGLGNGSYSGNMGIGAQGQYAPTPNITSDNGGGIANPFSDGGFGQTFGSQSTDGTFGNMGGGTSTQFGNISYNPSANPAPSDWGSGGGNTSSAPSAPSSGDTSGYAGSGATSGYGGGDTSSTASSGGYSASSGGYYAHGGAVHSMRRPPRYHMPDMMAAGGQVPQQLSPSGGRKVDDIPARGPGNSPMHLNANEFVIPRDVAMWKGQEFFQKLINDSRKANATTPAHPSQGGQGQQQRPMQRVQVPPRRPVQRPTMGAQ